MDRPDLQDPCQTWLSLFELFESASGLKLRVNIAETALVRDGRILGWFFTSRDGVVVRASNHEISPQALYQKLTGSQGSTSASMNPFNYVALAHYESGVSRPLKQAELQQLLQHMVGPFDTMHSWPDNVDECPFSIQAYVPPMKDMRYITTYGGPEGLQACSTFARRFSLRYTHAQDSGLAATPQVSQCKAPRTVAAAATHEPPPLSAEEMLVESQLVALGLLEPRDMAGQAQVAGDVSAPDSMVSAEAVLPVPKAVKAEIQRLVQTLQSYIERAHGLRIQGLVAEFLQPAPDTVMLLAVRAVQWDSRSSRGRLGTFTERWADFVSGTGPAPAARPTSKRNFAPAMLASAESLNAAGGTTASASDGTTSGRGHPWGYGNGGGNETIAVYDARPGSAPSVIMQRYRPNPFYPSSIHSKSKDSSVAGSLESSYALWMPRDSLATDTIAGALALELEVVRERLQRQTCSAARAEAALSSMAVNSKSAQESLTAQVEDMKAELAHLRSKKREMEGEYDRMRSERQSIKSEIGSARDELMSAKSEVEQERATLSSQIRTAQSTEERKRDTMVTLRTEHEDLIQQVSLLQRKADEGSEVIDAIKMQLVDYKSMVQMLQSQLRRGKNHAAVGAAGADGKTPTGDDVDADVATPVRSRPANGHNRESALSRPIRSRAG